MLRNILSKFGGEGFGSEEFPILLILRCFVVQKIFGFNRQVPWPVHWTSKVIAPEKIYHGTRCPGLSMGCHIDGRNGIEFGKNVWVGPRVSIVSMNHNSNDFNNYVSTKPIVIGDNCWLATNSVVLPGVEIGDHTVVAAGAVVTKSFVNGNQVLAGVPARIVKKLDDYAGDQ